MASPALRDCRILVVEDEFLIAMNLSHDLEAAGSVVLGPVPSVDKAIKKIESEPNIDAAVADVNLGGVLAYAVADMLLARKIPFVFTSGYEDDAFARAILKSRTASSPIFSSTWNRPWPTPSRQRTAGAMAHPLNRGL
jgi:CheY-like chemotaxis protein